MRQPSLVARQAALFTAPAAEASPQSPSPRRALFGQQSLGSAADRAAAAQPLLRGLSRSNILAEAKWAPAATVGRCSSHNDLTCDPYQAIAFTGVITSPHLSATLCAGPSGRQAEQRRCSHHGQGQPSAIARWLCACAQHACSSGAACARLCSPLAASTGGCYPDGLRAVACAQHACCSETACTGLCSLLAPPPPPNTDLSLGSNKLASASRCCHCLSACCPCCIVSSTMQCILPAVCMTVQVRMLPVRVAVEACSTLGHSKFGLYVTAGHTIFAGF